MPMYFAYGCLMNRRLFEAIVPDATFISRARLPGVRLCFPRFCAHWQGGVAGLEPQGEAEVEGVVLRLPREGLDALDAAAGVGRGECTRRELLVISPEGCTLSAWLHWTNPQEDRPFAPAPAYLSAMLEGARAHDLSPPYIARLEKLIRGEADAL